MSAAVAASGDTTNKKDVRVTQSIAKRDLGLTSDDFNELIADIKRALAKHKDEVKVSGIGASTGGTDMRKKENAAVFDIITNEILSTWQPRFAPPANPNVFAPRKIIRQLLRTHKAREKQKMKDASSPQHKVTNSQTPSVALRSTPVLIAPKPLPVQPSSLAPVAATPLPVQPSSLTPVTPTPLPVQPLAPSSLTPVTPTPLTAPNVFTHQPASLGPIGDFCVEVVLSTSEGRKYSRFPVSAAGDENAPPSPKFTLRDFRFTPLYAIVRRHIPTISHLHVLRYRIPDTTLDMTVADDSTARLALNYAFNNRSLVLELSAGDTADHGVGGQVVGLKRSNNINVEGEVAKRSRTS